MDNYRKSARWARGWGFFVLSAALLPAVWCGSCAKTASRAMPDSRTEQAGWWYTVSADGVGTGWDETDTVQRMDLLIQALLNAELPAAIANHVREAAAGGSSFWTDLALCLSGDPALRALVDKSHPLPGGYEPGDLVELSGPSYRVNRNGHLLRRAAAESLEAMAAAAAAEGVRLMASSAYRSYAYQREVYARNVREMGEAAADRESARPGYSQHQTGLVVDFGSIDDSFAATAAGRWMAARAGGFGWSLSFPEGYEAVTGYRWESWHYRYVGPDLAAFIDAYFGGIQQYALRFLHEWDRQP